MTVLLAYQVSMHFLPPKTMGAFLLPLCSLLLFAGSTFAEESFADYLRRSANPYNLGLREDGRFYPYASPVGRRIGFRQEVTEKQLFRDGWSEKEALESFNRKIALVESEWREKLPAEYGRNFDELPVESRELFVDFGLSEGVDEVRPDFVKAALELDWKRMLDHDVYVRYEKVWPHTERNKPFYERWSGKVESP